MPSYLEIVRNTLIGILRSRVLYVVLFLTAIIAATSVLPFMLLEMASEAGEGEAVEMMKSQSIISIFGLWSTAAYAMALFMGATAVSSEVKNKTIVTVLSKPVERWKYLVANWLGIEIFLLLFLASGILVVTAALQVFDAQVTMLFWVGTARTFLTVTILATAALALATVATPVFAACLPILLSILGSLVELGSDDPSIWIRSAARGFYLLMPAAMPGNLLGQGISSEAIHPEWGLYVQVMAENTCYALVLLTFGCLIFSTRELDLK